MRLSSTAAPSIIPSRKSPHVIPRGTRRSNEEAQTSPPVAIRHARPVDYWAAADLHCRVFSEEKKNRIWPQGKAGHPHMRAGVVLPSKLDALLAFMNRVDRAACIQALSMQAQSGTMGNCVLLLAFQYPTRSGSTGTNETVFLAHQEDLHQAADDESGPHSSLMRDATTYLQLNAQLKSMVRWAQGMPVSRSILHSMLNGLDGGLGYGAEEIGLVGVGLVDSFGDLVPPRSLDAERDGMMGWCKREGMAYISNVAVLPSARGRGIARRLLEEAHRLAESWGCRSVGLHCNLNNSSAVGLYTSMGYRVTQVKVRRCLSMPDIKELAIIPLLSGRMLEGRCNFFLRRLSGH